MDYLTIGDYTVTFDEQGAFIERRRPRATYRITAATATNAIDFMRHHRTLCFAMMKNVQRIWWPTSARHNQRRWEMKSFEELKSLLSRDLAELKKLQDSRFTTIEKRHVKEQEIGHLCYEAEEDLGTLELNALKRTIGMSEREWRTYKALFIAGSSPGDLT